MTKIDFETLLTKQSIVSSKKQIELLKFINMYSDSKIGCIASDKTLQNDLKFKNDRSILNLIYSLKKIGILNITKSSLKGNPRLLSINYDVLLNNKPILIDSKTLSQKSDTLPQLEEKVSEIEDMISKINDLTNLVLKLTESNSLAHKKIKELESKLESVTTPTAPIQKNEDVQSTQSTQSTSISSIQSEEPILIDSKTLSSKMDTLPQPEEKMSEIQNNNDCESNKVDVISSSFNIIKNEFVHDVKVEPIKTKSTNNDQEFNLQKILTFEFTEAYDYIKRSRLINNYSNLYQQLEITSTNLQDLRQLQTYFIKIFNFIDYMKTTNIQLVDKFNIKEKYMSVYNILKPKDMFPSKVDSTIFKYFTWFENQFDQIKEQQLQKIDE